MLKKSSSRPGSPKPGRRPLLDASTGLQGRAKQSEPERAAIALGGEPEGRTRRPPQTLAAKKQSKKKQASAREPVMAETGKLRRILLAGLVYFVLIMLGVCGFYFFEALIQLSPDERAKQIGGMILGLLALLGGPVGLWILGRKQSK